MNALTFESQTVSHSPIASIEGDRNLPSRRAVIAGRILSGLGVAFLTMDTVMKFVTNPEAIKATESLGWAASALSGIALLELLLLALYLLPRTAVLGAVLWTGYLGGAVASHVRVDNPLFSHVLFPVYIAVLLWLGLWLRDARLRALTRA